jgi:nicotinamidase/pyrazinamidase
MRALIVVDVQKDFCEGGALAVPGGTEVAEKIADFVHEHAGYYKRTVFTKDWHNPLPDTNGGHFGDPPDFVDSWPVHCVGMTEGAQFHESFSKIDKFIRNFPQTVFKKGQGQPHYSGFQGENFIGQSLNGYLKIMGIEHVDVVGLASDYCVRETALDAVRTGFKTMILPDLTAGITEFGTVETIKMVMEAQKK